MEKITLIDRFDGGIVNEPRHPDRNVCRMVTNFDILTNPKKMTPYRSSESGDSAASTSQKQNFCIAYSGSAWLLYALGVKSGAATAQVLTKVLTTGGSSDLGDDSWSSAIGNNESASGAAHFELFVYYKKTGKIYGARSNRYIWCMEADGGAWTDAELDLTSFTNLAQGLVHSKDDILYVPYDNKIAKCDNGNWTAAALTLPSYYYISSICEYGNYLAIACAPLSGVGKSRVYLWDRDSALTTLSENIDWGTEALKIIEEVDGYLIGISISGGIGATGASAVLKNKISFKRYISGGLTKEFDKLIGENTNTELPIFKQKINNRLFFMMRITLNGAIREGVWSVGRSSESAPFGVVHERTPNNDTALGGTGRMKGFFFCGDYLFQSYLSDATTYALSKTNDQATYAITAIYEKKFNTINSRTYKKLIIAEVMTEPLPADGQVVLKYKKDEATTWTPIFTNTTNDSISYGAVRDASSDNLAQYKELDIRIESYGGAEITGLYFKEEIIDKTKS